MSKQDYFEKWTLLRLRSRETCWMDKSDKGSYMCKDNVSYLDNDCFKCFERLQGEQK